MKVRLLIAFWGHKPGTLGRIGVRGRLKLRGSPSAAVRCGDLGRLFEEVTP